MFKILTKYLIFRHLQYFKFVNFRQNSKKNVLKNLLFLVKKNAF